MTGPLVRVVLPTSVWGSILDAVADRRDQCAEDTFTLEAAHEYAEAFEAVAAFTGDIVGRRFWEPPTDD